MKKQFLFVLFIAISTFIQAQVDAKYLQGAVPEENGKVVFSKTISVANQVSTDKLFELMTSWANKNYNETAQNTKQRILLADASARSIACQGNKDLIFKSSAISLDKSVMAYQLILEVVGSTCKATIKNIKFDYNDTSSKMETLTAENMISDKVALNKGKLNRYFDKFRIHAVDAVDGVFDSIDVYLNGKKASEGVVSSRDEVILAPVASISPQPVAVTVAADVTDPTMPGYKKIEPDKIPGNYIKLLNDWTLITSGTTEETNVMTASWGGLGMFWGKPVAFCFLGSTRYSRTTMDKGDTYTISFYTEAYKEAMQYCGSNSGRNTDKIKGSGLTPIKTPSGATAFAEAWMILECRKILAQPLSKEAVFNQDTVKDWTKGELHKMYVGEIVNVWIK